MFESLFAISFVGAMLWYLAELLIWPWKHSQNRIRDLEKAINNAEKDEPITKVRAWLNAPALRGNVQLYRELLKAELEFEKRKYEIYSSLRRDGDV